MNLLVNLTMRQAVPLRELGNTIFESIDAVLAERAITTLMALGSLARRDPTEPGLLPCRVHTFYRGLPGLWACVDPTCRYDSAKDPNKPAGQLFSQPTDTCDCGARVFELFTCRNCGSAYALAYTHDLRNPTYLWNEPGMGFLSTGGMVAELQPLDLCLEEPLQDGIEPADLDLETGRLN